MHPPQGIGGGVETIEKYANVYLANGATYTPAASGIFFMVGRNMFAIVYSNFNLVNATLLLGATAIGDGTNLMIRNNSGAGDYLCLMRLYLSSGIYQLVGAGVLTAGTSYTPATSGFFAFGVTSVDMVTQINITNVGWTNIVEAEASHPATIPIGDGTNLRLYNQGVSTYSYSCMRARMTP